MKNKIKSCQHSKRHFSQYLLEILIIVLISGAIASCQNKKKTDKNASDTTKVSVTNPKVDIKVNRKYDDKGNLIEFDSTYSSFYATKEKHSSETDSLIRNFSRIYVQKHPSLMDEHFNKLFFLTH